ncbi:hypothetical protein TNCV_1126401 [Trichonephila clavipes]|nr:hypothetical protein TNCV_1126401 [Trichonephila clavipes]
MNWNLVALSEYVKLGGHTKQQVVTCNVQTQLCKGAGSNGCYEELIDKMEGQDAQIEARCEARSTGPNCFNGTIVYYPMYYSLFTTPMVPSSISPCLAEVGLGSQRPL